MMTRHCGRRWHCKTVLSSNLHYAKQPQATQWPDGWSKRKAMARLRQLNPALRISNLKDVLDPYQHAEDLTRYSEGLRRAGLPE
jgi:hypothetical protein